MNTQLKPQAQIPSEFSRIESVGDTSYHLFPYYGTRLDGSSYVHCWYIEESNMSVHPFRTMPVMGGTYKECYRELQHIIRSEKRRLKNREICPIEGHTYYCVGHRITPDSGSETFFCTSCLETETIIYY